jgi:serine/threonine-protein kinase HipA
MESVTKITVKLHLQGGMYDVGSLVFDKKSIYFRYDEQFLDTNLNISPIVLSFNTKVNKADTHIFESLYGVFADSLPDGWGKLLMDRYFLSHYEQLNTITPLDRLSLIGHFGMGALEYFPVSFNHVTSLDAVDSDFLYSETRKILNDVASENIIDYLFQLGGSSGGARPKVLVNYDFNTKDITTDIKENSESLPCILKFPSCNDLPDIANIEYAYYLMAKNAGIEMSKSELVKSAKGKYFFITQRFDRNQFGKLHMHSAAGLLHDDFRYSKMDYGHLMDAAFRMEKSVGAYDKIISMAYFNLLTNNRDDHSKNFSFLMDGLGQWLVAPAYDLTYSTTSHGYHSTSFDGESKDPSLKNIRSLAEIFKVTNIHHIIDQVNESVNQWNNFANIAGVSSKSSTIIGKYIKQKLGY